MKFRVEIVSSLIFVTLLLAGNNAQAQKLREFSIDDVSRVCMDRLGDFYLISDKTKAIRKYDTDGLFMSEYIAGDSAEITLLEPWNPLRLFVYSKPKQEVFFLDRQLAKFDHLKLDPAFAFSPVLASPSPNNSFWILDGSDNSLKKIDAKGTHVEMEMVLKTDVKQKVSYSYLREYQNQLFLIDPNTGVHIFSFVGKPIKQILVTNLNYLGFLGEEIYYLEPGKVKFYDLYSEEQRELAVDAEAKFVLLTDERMVLIKKDKVEVWVYKP